jgi:hypothetical protein
VGERDVVCPPVRGKANASVFSQNGIVAKLFVVSFAKQLL